VRAAAALPGAAERRASCRCRCKPPRKRPCCCTARAPLQPEQEWRERIPHTTAPLKKTRTTQASMHSTTARTQRRGALRPTCQQMGGGCRLLTSGREPLSSYVCSGAPEHHTARPLLRQDGGGAHRGARERRVGPHRTGDGPDRGARSWVSIRSANGCPSWLTRLSARPPRLARACWC